ncbi:penicillin acyltransferase, partial [Arthrobacter deserti]|nr:penicillin acyltransferase [Arthrobacter deserti]
TVHGIAEQDVRRHALESLDAVAGWAPELAREIEGTARGAGLEDWQVAALNARTEILALGRHARPRECSTIIANRQAPFSMQTWDWHVELANAWHLQAVTTGSRAFVGLTEYGTLGKIGFNDAGVGVHLNVLGHR